MKPMEEFPAIKKAVNDGIVTGLHRLHTENPDPTYLDAQEHVIGAIKSYLDALVEKPPVKTYCGGKANYCTPEVTGKAFVLDRGCWERGCVAYDERDGDGVNISAERVDETAKGKREWVGLTEEEAIDLLPVGDWEIEPTLVFAKAIEATLKEKNT